MTKKRREPLSDQEPEGRESQKRKFVACVPHMYLPPRLSLTLDSCQRCHSHKIKCSGDVPCSKCRSVGCADECAYSTRDRQVKVSEKYVSKSTASSQSSFSEAFPRRSILGLKWSASISYLDQILAENQRLRAQSTTSAPAAEPNDPRSDRYDIRPLAFQVINMSKRALEGPLVLQTPQMAREFRIR